MFFVYAPQSYAAETMFVYDARDIVLAVLLGAVVLIVLSVYVTALVSVGIDKLRARLSKGKL